MIEIGSLAKLGEVFGAGVRLVVVLRGGIPPTTAVAGIGWYDRVAE